MKMLLCAVNYVCVCDLCGFVCVTRSPWKRPWVMGPCWLLHHLEFAINAVFKFFLLKPSACVRRDSSGRARFCSLLLVYAAAVCLKQLQQATCVCGCWMPAY
jgi:hypothetical protein